MASQTLELELKQQFKLARQLSSQGFPSLVLRKGGKLYAIPLDYNDSQTMQQAIMQHTSEAQ
jgi:protein-disulfide isomerase-like protein with CxxC motif